MAKRFTDTGKWDKRWFRELPCRLKCAWEFLRDRCDRAGIWEVDLDTLKHYLGEPVTLQEILTHFKVISLDETRLFIPGFISFQYGKLSDGCKPHHGVIEILKGYGIDPYTLTHTLPKGIQRDKDKEEEEYKEEEKEKEGGVGGDFPPTPPKTQVVRADVKECAVAWCDALKKHGIDRGLMPTEEQRLGAAIQRHGKDPVLLAILGAKYEPDSRDFKASRFVSLKRTLDPQHFERFVNLGSQARRKIQERAEQEREYLGRIEQAQAPPAAIVSVTSESADKTVDVRSLIKGGLKRLGS